MKKRTGDLPSGPRRTDSKNRDKPDVATRLVATGKHSVGVIRHDELGQPRWAWVTEIDPPRDTSDTFDYLKALDTDMLSVADEPGATAPVRKDAGYDPYNKPRASLKPRERRRRP